MTLKLIIFVKIFFLEILKKGNTKTHLHYLDLLGDDELALSKGFAYLVSSDFKILNHFINKTIDKPLKINKHNFKNIEIKTEFKRDEGRTDIEIYLENEFLIIIECKIGKGKINKQAVQYDGSFNNYKNTHTKIIYFITNEIHSIVEINKEISKKYLTWNEILNYFEIDKFLDNKLVTDFLNFLNKYTMNQTKEILIQDISDNTEVEIYFKNHVYRRNKTSGIPLYFAPYFTKKALEKNPTRTQKGEIEKGILYLSKILGVITFNPFEENSNKFENIKNKLITFSEDKNLVNKWIDSFKDKINKKDEKNIITFYFLCDEKDRIKLDYPLIKNEDTGWVSLQINKNKGITFKTFLEQIQKQK